jgi:hypothetical protein
MTQIELRYVDLLRLTVYLQTRSVRFWFFNVFVPILFCALVLLFVFSPATSLDVKSVFAVLTCLVILVSLWPLRMLYGTHVEHHRMSKEGMTSFSIAVDPSGITLATQTAESHVTWEHFTAIIETKSLFLLRRGQQSIVVLPKDQLGDVGAVRDAIRINYHGRVRLREEFPTTVST